MTTGEIVSRPDSQEVGIAVVVDRDQSPAKTSKFLHASSWQPKCPY